MTLVIDILLIILFLFSMFKYGRLGLACSILNAGRFFISILAGLLLCYPVGSVMYELGVSESLSGITAFLVVFIAVFILSKILIKMLSKIKIPLVTTVDKLLGTLLGAILGIIWVSLLSTALYTVLEVISAISQNTEVMNLYENSHIFRHIYDLEIFEFIRNLF